MPALDGRRSEQAAPPHLGNRLRDNPRSGAIAKTGLANGRVHRGAGAGSKSRHASRGVRREDMVCDFAPVQRFGCFQSLDAKELAAFAAQLEEVTWGDYVL